MKSNMRGESTSVRAAKIFDLEAKRFHRKVKVGALNE